MTTKTLDPDELMFLWNALQAAKYVYERDARSPSMSQGLKQQFERQAKQAEAFAEVFLNMPTVIIKDDIDDDDARKEP